MSSAEMAEWIAYANVEPLPDPYWIGAQVCQVVANALGSGRKRRAVDDFLPRVVKRRARRGRMSVEETAGYLGRKYRENEAAALKAIAAGRV